jgi:hypothetical protein
MWILPFTWIRQYPGKFRHVSKQISRLLSSLGVRQWISRGLRCQGVNTLVKSDYKEQVASFHHIVKDFRVKNSESKKRFL